MHQNVVLKGHRDSAENDLEVRKSDVTYSGNLVELL